MKNNLRKSSIPEKIFSFILESLDEGFFMLYNPRAVLSTCGDVESARNMLARKQKKARQISNKEFNRALKSLQKRNYLTCYAEGEKILIAMTQAGIEEALKRQIKQKRRKLKKQERVYVSFDIPEVTKSVRVALRRLLKESGFTMVQMSLWSSRRDVGKEFAKFIELIGAKKWIYVFIGSPITKK